MFKKLPWFGIGPRPPATGLISIEKYAIWVSRHGDGKFAFEERYDTEQNLLDETNRLIT